MMSVIQLSDVIVIKIKITFSIDEPMLAYDKTDVLYHTGIYTIRVRAGAIGQASQANA